MSAREGRTRVVPQKIKDRVNRSAVDALKIDLEAGLTRALIASQAPERSAKRLRNQREARKAFDSVTSFMKRVSLTPTDVQEIDTRLARLKSALERLGDSF